MVFSNIKTILFYWFIYSLVIHLLFIYSSVQNFRWMEQRPFNFFSCLSLSKISSQLLLSSHTTDPKIQNLNPQKQNHEKILNAVKVTPSLHEDLQVEVMKVGLTHSQFASLWWKQIADPHCYLKDASMWWSFGLYDYYPCLQSPE